MRLDAVTLVIAHRGAWGEHPENTLEAFEQAVRIGADMIELDVRQTADGHLIAHHDPVHATRHDELAAPLLDDVIAQFAGRIPLNLELKEHGHEARVIAMLTRQRAGDFLVTSFHEEVVRETKRRAPRIRAGLVVARGSAEDPLARARRCDADYLVLQVGLRTISDIQCLVWTVNETAALDRCLRDPAVAGVITDRPELALTRRARLSDRTDRAERR